VLADEPTGELDAAAAGIIKLVKRLNRERGTTFVIVTHDPAVARMTDRISEIASGTVACQAGSALEEDWRQLCDSALGSALLDGRQSSAAIPTSLHLLTCAFPTFSPFVLTN
jgi:ABC-type methionine transport system ATPase subunit